MADDPAPCNTKCGRSIQPVLRLAGGHGQDCCQRYTSVTFSQIISLVCSELFCVAELLIEKPKVSLSLFADRNLDSSPPYRHCKLLIKAEKSKQFFIPIFISSGHILPGLLN